MLTAVHVMGEYWHTDRDEPTDLGRLVAAAKDRAERAALAELETRLADFAAGLDLPLGPLVLPVPPAPGRDAHPVPSLAAAVAEVLDVDLMPGILTRQHDTPRLRDTPPTARGDIVAAAGYAVGREAAGRRVVLVDDVVLTGTTLRHIAGLLADAGATEVVGLVCARTRLR